MNILKRKNKSTGIYDYSDTFSREETVKHLLSLCARSKSPINSYWKKMRSYYDGPHEIRTHNTLFSHEKDIPWEAAQSTDGYIHIESQIETKVPEFEFSPRGKDDTERAKQREAVTKYVCDINSLELKNAINERRLNILGTAVFKVCWDSSVFDGKNYGDVTIDTPKPQQIFCDPSATDVDSCEYIGYMYKLHKQKAKRIFAHDFERMGESADDFLDSPRSNHGYHEYTSQERQNDTSDDTVTVTEWWFRQPTDGEKTVKCLVDGKETGITYKWRAGDIALCILLGDKEIRYIPKYWKNTECSMFPFVIYTKIPNEDSIWGKSELEAIIPLIDASDRELAYAQLNSAFSSNDIIVAEENALSDDGELDNSPGAVWKLRPGMMGKIQRLGNASYAESNLYNNSMHWRNLMQETTGNFEINQGKEPSKVTTASGIALLNERAKNRQALKKTIKAQGFRRLYELVDRTALEYYSDGRVLAIGALGDKEKVFRFADYATYPEGSETAYIPVVDVIIHIGDGVSNSKAFTVQALSELINSNITDTNYKLIESYAELIGLPMRQEICDILEEKFAGNKTPLLPSAQKPALPTIDELLSGKEGSPVEALKEETK